MAREKDIYLIACVIIDKLNLINITELQLQTFETEKGSGSMVRPIIYTT